MLIYNSQLVPNWANWKHFDELEKKGLMMYGQMTVGNWIHIGSQGIVQDTCETFTAIANKDFGGSLKGTLAVTAGLGGMGGALPLAVTMNDGVCLVAEVEQWRIDKRLITKYLNESVEGIDAGIDRALEAKKNKERISICVACNAVHLLERLKKKKVISDVLTDQTSAHDPLVDYIPHPISLEESNKLREKDPDIYIDLVFESMKEHVSLMLICKK